MLFKKQKKSWGWKILFEVFWTVLECTQNLGQIIWKLVFYLLKLSLRKVIWKKYIDEFKMLILELLEEGKIEIIKKQSYIFK